MKRDQFEYVYETKIPRISIAIFSYIKSFLKFYFLGFISLFLIFSLMISILGIIPKENTLSILIDFSLKLSFLAIWPAIIPASMESKKKRYNVFDFEKKINLVPLLKRSDSSYTVPINLRFYTGKMAKNIVWVENFTFRAKLRLLDLDIYGSWVRDDYYEEEYFIERNYFDNHILSKLKDGYIIDNFRFNFYKPGEPYIELSKDKVEIDFTDYLKEEEEKKNLNGEVLNLDYFLNKQKEFFNKIMSEFNDDIDPDMIPESVVERFAKMISDYGVISFKTGELNIKENL